MTHFEKLLFLSGGNLYGKGHHLYIDNWYTGEKLFNHLQLNGTAASGTGMSNRFKGPLL